MKRTNVMLTDSQHAMLSSMARREGRSLGEKIRDAIDKQYIPKDAVEKKQAIALLAYQQGFISLGKLSEALGLDPVSARDYLKAKGVKLRMPDKEDLLKDLENA